MKIKMMTLMPLVGLVASALASCSTIEGSVAKDPAATATFEVGQGFRDCESCPLMVVVPAGSFEMGSTRAEQDWAVEGEIEHESPGHEDGVPHPPHAADRERADRENPRHQEIIPHAFAVGAFEVTRGEFERFVNETGHEGGNKCGTYELEGEQYKYSTRENRNWRNPGHKQTNQDPVVCVSWEEAKAYAQWLSEETGADYRLLSEAEWEYAARAGTSTYRFWGDDRDNSEACAYANVRDQTPLPNGDNWPDDMNACNDRMVLTAPVGSYNANPFGLYDMLGNVWEWAEDCWNETYAGAPGDGAARLDGDCSRRVLRGGGWSSSPAIVRSATRLRDTYTDRGYNIGFRLARTLSE